MQPDNKQNLDQRLSRLYAASVPENFEKQKWTQGVELARACAVRAGAGRWRALGR